MRILMITSFFKDKYSPTLGSFFLDQAIALQKSGNEVTIVYPDIYSIKHLKKYLNYNEKNEVINGVKIYRMNFFAPFKYKIHGYSNTFSNACIKMIEKNNLYKERFDVIHAQNAIWAGYAAMKISKKYGIPYVITEHSSLLGFKSSENAYLPKKKINRIYSNASSVIAVSKKLSKDVKKFYDGQIEIIGNIVDTDTYVPDDCQKNGYTFIFVATLGNMMRVKLKGIEKVIEAFSTVCSKNTLNQTKLKLKIVGVPKSMTYVSELVKNKKIEKNVEIYEPLERKKIISEMQHSDCFIMPSLYETFGLVYAEAMSAGLPIIATDVGIASEIVNNKTGILCENDVEDIAKKMMYMIDSKEKYDATFIHNFIKNIYSEESIVKEISKIYNEVERNYYGK